MSKATSDTEAWVKAREVAYEIGRLVEIVKGGQVQVGFTISLFARLPMEAAPGAERQAKAAEIRDGLREIIDAIVLPESSRARVEIEPPRAAVVLESGKAPPDVVLTARVFRRDDYFSAVTWDEESRLRWITRQLTEMGLQERRPLAR